MVFCDSNREATPNCHSLKEQGRLIITQTLHGTKGDRSSEMNRDEVAYQKGSNMKAMILALKLVYYPHPQVDLSAAGARSFESAPHFLRLSAGCAPDLPAEAAEDGEEPQDHVGQGQGVNNILPGKFLHLRNGLLMAQDLLTCGPGERCTGFPRSRGLERALRDPIPELPLHILSH